MTFLDYLALLQRRWRACVSMIAVGLLVGLGLGLLAEEQYVAIARSFVTVADEDAAGAGESFQGAQFVTQRMVSYAALSTSPTVVDGVLEALDLDLTPSELNDMVDVSSPTGTVMLEVAVRNRDQELAAAVADEVSEQLGLLIEEVETPRGLAASSVEVVLTHPAAVPTEPSSPRVRLGILLGGVVGAAAGVLLALVREHADRRLRTAADVRAVTGTRPLGSTSDGDPAGEPLVALDQRSAGAEQYRAVRDALAVTRAAPLRDLAVTSPTEGEGRAVETANLAITGALGGARVCLVDAGLRQGALSRVLGVEDDPGLGDVLVGDTELASVLHPWRDGLLHVLPAGLAPPDPAALLASEAMTLLVTELRARFDLVVYDVGATDVADAVVVARALDGVLVVVRAGRTTREELTDSLETLRGGRAEVLGTVRSGGRRRRERRAGRGGDQRRTHRALEPNAMSPSV
ncbi:polysaccharide biosynthesis tyrosine autokinase [Georgenia wutianyii]|uniref:Polysaccharide biosynthesis tyrosine autokinase n=1 Tax=Georgenia wutianyii TaxID=2585135 RepID=A0ABX5VPP2_9MICO|nr:polysaccharide biosynthesis tyrosine autokinase [Georgenia wutianyii]QDB80178.1 polysaccharide biosynthesis tyrosine autokinase [Georgenia wutianyii]